MAPVKFPRILGDRGGDPGRPGRRPLGGLEEAAGRPGGKLALPVGALGDPGFFRRGMDFPPRGAAVGGTTLVAQNGSKRTENSCFPDGAGPAPWPDSQPTWSMFIGSTGSAKPPCIVTFL